VAKRYVVQFFNERTNQWQRYLTKSRDSEATKLAKDLNAETELRTRVLVQDEHGNPA
jgi:hypothetical protein